MAPFHGSDQRLDREIETLEEIARVRVRRAARELREMDQELSELRRERVRRRAGTGHPASELRSATAEA
jgi:hypothetical protein